MDRPSLQLVRWVALRSLAIGLLVSASPALAQPGVRLRYDVDTVAGCPDEAALRALVASRIGGVPYVDDGLWQVHVLVRVADAGLEAQVSLVGPDGEARGQHTLVSEGDCVALISSVALTLSLVHDVVREEAASEPASDPTAAAHEPLVPDAPERPPALASVDTVDRTDSRHEDGDASAPVVLPAIRWWIGGGPVLGYGLLPSASLGLRAVVALGGESMYMRVGFRADLPRPINTGAPVLRLGWLVSTLAVCGRWRAVDACALGRVAVAYVPPGVRTTAPRPRSVNGGAGVELGFRVWGRGRAQLQAHVGVAVPFARTRILVDDVTLFRERPVDVTAGLGVLWGQP